VAVTAQLGIAALAASLTGPRSTYVGLSPLWPRGP
jgi:hypothetical protein